MQQDDLPFVGTSETLSVFLEKLRAVASSEATVLFFGESGTGKTSAARWLHEESARAAGPFVALNLAATAPTLIEAALFGHEKGAFTDAHRARRGAFRRASAGTLVLDDVDLLPVELQVKLLRALQERVVEPLGAEAPVEVDVRVVATTNAQLEELVKQGTFREDLYYRLAVVTLEVPSLRARLEDLALLVGPLLARVAGRSGVPVRGLAPAALERLQAHSWPGNVRELENALERVSVLGTTGGDVRPEELDFLAESTDGIADDLAQQALANGLGIDDVAQAMMQLALREHRGNLSAAARAVGLTRRAFDYRMRQKEDGAETEDPT